MCNLSPPAFLFVAIELEHEYNLAPAPRRDDRQALRELGVIVLLGRSLSADALGAPGLSGWLIAPLLVLVVRRSASCCSVTLDDGARGAVFLAWFGVKGASCRCTRSRFSIGRGVCRRGRVTLFLDRRVSAVCSRSSCTGSGPPRSPAKLLRRETPSQNLECRWARSIGILMDRAYGGLAVVTFPGDRRCPFKRNPGFGTGTDTRPTRRWTRLRTRIWHRSLDGSAWRVEPPPRRVGRAADARGALVRRPRIAHGSPEHRVARRPRRTALHADLDGPIRRRALLEARAEVLALAERLRTVAYPRPQGVALAADLLPTARVRSTTAKPTSGIEDAARRASDALESPCRRSHPLSASPSRT